MDESKLLDMFIRQIEPPIADDLIPDEPPPFVGEVTNCVHITTKFSTQDGIAYKL